MANIFEFVNNNKNTKNEEFASQNEKKSENIQNNFYQQMSSNYSEEQINKAYESINKYKDLNQNQLIKLLYNNILESKKNGTFNYQELKASIDSIYPMLNEQQQNLLSKLLEEIKWLIYIKLIKIY